MEWQSSWTDPFQEYLKPFASLIGDRRTWEAFSETIKGIIASGSTVAQRIAANSAGLSRGKKGSQRVLRMAKGESTKRSSLNAEHLSEHLRQVGIEALQKEEEEEIWLVADGSNLRKPYAQSLPYLMQVKDERGKLVPGYRSLTVLGMTPGHRGVLYQKVLSCQEPDFLSEPAEVQMMLSTVSQALVPLKAKREMTWILDCGFDDVAAWRTIWEQQEHVVCRVYHRERQVDFQTEQGEWVQGSLEQAAQRLRLLARVQTTMEVPLGKQKHPKKQDVEVEVSGCSCRLTYDREVRRGHSRRGQRVQKDLWLVQVRVVGCSWEPWWLLTDWPVETEVEAARLFGMYRQRWGIEESFKFTKTCLGWEQVQVLDWQAIKTLVALAWVAAGFLYEMGVTFSWEEVQLLARLGGYEPHKNRSPGKMVLLRGLSRLLELLSTQAILSRYASEHGGLPPKIAAFLPGWPSPGEL